MDNSNKVTKTYPHYLYGKSNASKKINLYKLMGEKNIGPKVRGSTKGFLKSTMNLNMNNVKGKIDNARWIKNFELTKGDMKKIIKLVLKMHKEGYYHGDILSNKVIWKQLEDGKNFRLIGFKNMGKIEDKLDYQDALSAIKSRPTEIYEMRRQHKNHVGDLLSLYFTLRQIIWSGYNMKQKNYNDYNYDGDYYYDLMKENEYIHKFSKWFRETVETEVKNLNNKNNNRNNNLNNNNNKN